MKKIKAEIESINAKFFGVMLFFIILLIMLGFAIWDLQSQIDSLPHKQCYETTKIINVTNEYQKRTLDLLAGNSIMEEGIEVTYKNVCVITTDTMRQCIYYKTWETCEVK